MRSEDAGNPWRSMWAAAAVLAVAIFCYPLLLPTPLLDPDEGLMASIAQEMVERGDWLTPRLLGKPFLDKPVLFTWLRAVSLRLFGMSEGAVRFPGLTFGLLGAVTTGVVGWRMFGRRAGILAGMFYATLIIPTALAQAAMDDVALVPWVSLALLLFWEADRAATRRAAAGCTLAVGVLLGLSCLTKGLFGVALVGLAYGGYLLSTRRLTAAACLRAAAALAIAALVASPWYLAMEIRNPGYHYYYFVERHWLGYATDTQFHGKQPWWYYLPVLLGGGLPWIGYLPAVLRDQWARRRQSNRTTSDGAMMLLWSWLIGCAVFLSLSHSKLVTYTWPLFPPVAILAAVAWVRLIEGVLTERARRLLVQTFWLSSLAGPAVLPLALLVVQSDFAVRFPWPVWTASVLVAAGPLVPLGFWMAGRPRATLSASLLSLAAQFVVVMTFALKPVAATTSARDLADHFNRRGRIPPQLLIAEERIGSIVFYLDRDLRAGLREGQLQQVRLAELAGTEPGAMIALSQRHQERAARHFDLSGAEYQRVGRYRLYDATQFASRPLTVAAGSNAAMQR